MKTLFPHLTAVVVFILITFAYLSPLLKGEKIQQSDMIQYNGMSKEIVDYWSETGDETLWTNSMFGGMPAYLISVHYKSNLLRYVNTVLMKFFDKPAIYLFLSLIGFYILLLAFRVDPWLSLAGAIAFGFSSYFFVIGAVGHNTKYLAITFMPAIIGGIHLAFRGKLILGSAVTALFIVFQLLANHYQITYYTGLIILFYGIFELVKVIKDKQRSSFVNMAKVTGILILVAVIAFSTNITNFLLVNEYGKDSMRGKSELTDDAENKTTGLDKDYATAWSYGIAETMTLLVPNYHGGSSHGELSTGSETYKVLKNNGAPNARNIIKQLPLYWGTQPFTSGPVYVGAIIFFLFILGLFLVEGRIKWWLLSITIFSILLSWGRNFMFLTDLFLDYFPGYNKFRSVSMILVIAEFSMPLLGILALKRIVNGEIARKEFYKAFKWVAGIFGGIFVLFVLFAGMTFDFIGKDDSQLGEVLTDAIRSDRASIFWTDAFRSLGFIALAVVLILLFVHQKVKKPVFYVLMIGLFLLDMWPVDKRYLNNDNFEKKARIEKPFVASRADEFILKDTEPDYRVLNLAVNTFNDASTSYFHKSIGGYHGAKMKRYQELINYHISREMRQFIDTLRGNPAQMAVESALRSLYVLNMLNTRYIIYNKDAQPIINRYADGNAWFVEDYKIVENADEEINSLYTVDPGRQAVVDKRFSDRLEGFKPVFDPEAFIKLKSYQPNNLVYETNAAGEQLAVFSEIYYNDKKGWNAYIDGQEASHFRADFVLRAMRIPGGKHTIEFRFEPAKFYAGEKVSLAGSLLIILLFIGAVVREVMVRRKEK
ncbi:MAG: hypothetical protein KJ607_08665 [Bacteroidetes bacterium]|nr:hypothetical protein [Bacteroidota bacterium]